MKQLKKITFEECPFRSYEEVFGHIIEYCSIKDDELCSCDPESSDFPEDCLLFGNVEDEDDP